MPIDVFYLFSIGLFVFFIVDFGGSLHILGTMSLLEMWLLNTSSQVCSLYVHLHSFIHREKLFNFGKFQFVNVSMYSLYLWQYMWSLFANPSF